MVGVEDKVPEAIDPSWKPPPTLIDDAAMHRAQEQKEERQLRHLCIALFGVLFLFTYGFMIWFAFAVYDPYGYGVLKLEFGAFYYEFFQVLLELAFLGVLMLLAIFKRWGLYALSAYILFLKAWAIISFLVVPEFRDILSENLLIRFVFSSTDSGYLSMIAFDLIFWLVPFIIYFVVSRKRRLEQRIKENRL